jgi:hypothetical protein
VQEKKAFAGFPALKKLSGAKSPPQLYHQGELRERGGGGLAGDVRKTLSTTEHKIIGVVLNAVDDHLSSGSQVVSRWNIAQIAHLEQILDAAREAGRIVILTSDHGHVLEHDTEYRGSLSSPERYKTATDGTDEFEIKVSGPRVLTEDHVAILPWSEKVRYTRSRGYGYHGGGTLQEVVVPLGMFISDAKVPAGWNTTSLYYPDWWQAAPAPAVALTMTEPVTGKPTGKRKKAGDDATIDLFATAPEPQPSAASSWVDALLLSPVYQSQENRNLRFKIQDEQLQQLLQMLLKSGGQLPQIALATALKLPPMRISGFLAGVQKLLNVDGYPVLSVDRNTQMVKLDRELLKKQFELTE